MSKISCIYIIKSITKPDNYYIGSAVNLSKRVSVHKADLNLKRHHSRWLQRHVNKYGIDDIYFEILETVPEKNNLLEREQYYFDTMFPKFNTSKTAGSCLGLKASEETKKKISQNNGKPMLGKHHSEKTKAIMSAKRRLRITKDSTRILMSISRKNIKYSIETRSKMSAWQVGKILSTETKNKIGNGNRGKVISQSTRLKTSKALKGGQTSKAVSVINMNTKIIYHSAKDAAASINMDYEKLRNQLRGITINKTALIYFKNAG